MARTSNRTIVLLLGVLAVVHAPALAEDVAKKWRISLGLGSYMPDDDIPSNSANALLLRDEGLEPFAYYEDPRNDSGAFGSLDVQSGPLATLGVQYALSKVFMVEGSVGYTETDLGDIAVDIEFFGNPPPILEIPFNFDSFRINAGDLQRIPIQITGIARFRPRASFNPYVGVGIGYIVHGFTASDEFNELSQNMDAARGTRMAVTDSLDTDPTLSAGPRSDEDLSGATVDIRDTFEWHLVAGAEITLKRKWAIFGDLRWVDASRDLSIGFNSSSELGASVPQFEDFIDSEIGRQFLIGDGAGPIRITDGGLIDAGQRVYVPRETSPNAVCVTPGPPPGGQDDFCELLWFSKDEYDDPRLPDDFEPDNELDAGYHYAQGGSVSYDGFTLLIGVRYTF